MQEIEKIRNHPLYAECIRGIEKAEEERIFCRHQMQHLMDVARIAYILNLEQKMGFSREVIYGAALLHDIGRFRQYEDGTPHELAGREIAEKILTDTDTFPQERQLILDAVLEHRKQADGMTMLGQLLYDSDKLSRACYACAAEVQCDWSPDKKNLEIKY